MSSNLSFKKSFYGRNYINVVWFIIDKFDSNCFKSNHIKLNGSNKKRIKFRNILLTIDLFIFDYTVVSDYKNVARILVVNKSFHYLFVINWNTLSVYANTKNTIILHFNMKSKWNEWKCSMKDRMPPIISKVNTNFGNAMKTLIKQIQRLGFVNYWKWWIYT